MRIERDDGGSGGGGGGDEDDDDEDDEDDDDQKDWTGGNHLLTLDGDGDGAIPAGASFRWRRGELRLRI
jgi:hypothetical protein